jgi:alkylhydroperoxidase family enzyme
LAARIPEATPPFSGEIQDGLNAVTPKGATPLRLFTTLARDERLFRKFMAGGLLDRGHLELRQREIVIDRITALSGSEYEWGVHVAFFAKRAGLDEAQVASTAKSGAADPVWSDEDRVLLTVCDRLHETCDIDDAAWSALRAQFSEEAILEILMLAGFYRTVSYLTNALRLPCESWAKRFPERTSPLHDP